MPYYETSPMAAAANFLGEYYSAKDQRRKEDEDKARQDKLDAQNAALEQAQITQMNDAEQRANVHYSPKGPAPTRGKKESELDYDRSTQDYYAQQAAAAAAMGDKESATIYQQLAADYPRSAQQYGTADYDAARVDQIHDRIKNGFKQQYELLSAKLAGSKQIAEIRGSFQRARSQSRAGNPSDRDAIAYATAINRMNGMEYDKAYAAAQDQYNRQYAAYLKSYNSDSGQYSQPMPQMQMPQAPPITVNVPGQGLQVLEVPQGGGYIKPPSANAPKTSQAPPAGGEVKKAQDLIKRGAPRQQVEAALAKDLGISTDQARGMLYPGGGFGNP